MDVTRVDNVNLREIPVQALRSKVREKLSCMLNQRKLIRSPEGFYRDYRGLAELMELCIDNCWTPNNHNSIASLLDRSGHSLADLQEFLERIDRFDVLDDIRAQVYEDAVAWGEQKNQIVQFVESSDEKDFLTIDDIMESTKMYDAFLLYVDADMEFAAKILETLESQYNLKICVKDRLLGGAIFEHSAIMKLISNRCRRLIVVLSDEFVSSDKNTFFLDFAQFLSLEKKTKKRFIVPVKYKPCMLPDHYRVYFILDHMRSGLLVNFWEKLHASVLPVPEGNHSVCITELPRTNDSKCIESIAAKTVNSPTFLENGSVVCSTKKSTSNCDQNDSLVVKTRSKSTSASDKISGQSNRSTSSTTKLLSSGQAKLMETNPSVTRRKSVKSKLSKLFKRMSKNKSKKLPQAEPVACAS